MSEEEQQDERPIGKVRNPIVVIILFLFTFGIYPIIYYYKVFDELYEYRGQGLTGIKALIIIVFPVIQILSIIFPWLLPAYVGKLFEEDDQEKPINGLYGFLVIIPFGGLVLIYLIQAKLNQFWEEKAATA
jgi:hypothetical protein